MLHIQAPPLPILLGAGEDTYEIGQSHPNRKEIGVFDLLVVTKGCLYIGEDEKRYVVKEKHAQILFPNRHHFSYHPCDQQTHFYWFHFTSSKEWTVMNETITTRFDRETTQGRNPFSEFPFGIVVPTHFSIHNWKVIEQVCHHILQTDIEPNYSWEWQRQIHFQQLLQEISRITNMKKALPSLAVAEQAADYLRKNYQRKISYKELGEALNFHPNHIARCMIHTLGFTPIDYVNRVRLDQAKLFLVTTDWSIEKIAEKCGFAQIAYFSRFFKKHEGMSPNEFRKKFLG